MKKKFLITVISCFCALFCVAQVELNDAIEAYNNGMSYKDIKNYHAAANEFRRAVELATEVGAKASKVRDNAQEQAVMARMLIAADYYEKKDFNETFKALEFAKQDAEKYDDQTNLRNINASYARVYYALGTEDMSRNKFIDALKNFERSLAYTPEQSNVLLAMGVAYQRLNNMEKAISFYERTITAAQRSGNKVDGAEASKAVAHYFLLRAQKAQERSDLKTAFDDLSRALKYEDSNPEIFLQHALVANKLEKYKDAISTAERGIKASAKSSFAPKLMYQLAFAHEKNGNTVKARETYTKAQQTTDDTDKINVQNALRRLDCSKQ